MTTVGKFLVLFGSVGLCALQAPAAHAQQFKAFPKATVASVKTTHNHILNGEKGILIRVTLAVEDDAGQPLTVRASVYDSKGNSVWPHYSPEVRKQVEEEMERYYR